jgi:hypothetical protein
MSEKKTKKEEEQSLQVEIVKQLITLSSSGFGVVAALAWNNVIKEFVDGYVKRVLPDGSGLTSLFIYAIAVTILAVFVTYQLSKLLKTVEKK